MTFNSLPTVAFYGDKEKVLLSIKRINISKVFCTGN